MNHEELPEYKQTFLREMEELRQLQLLQQAEEGPSIIAEPFNKPRPPVENNIINTAQYSSSNWKQVLNQTSYGTNHDLNQHELNLLVNPEVKRKQNNIQLTPISQYSNAMHNKTVFVNPKFTSC